MKKICSFSLVFLLLLSSVTSAGPLQESVVYKDPIKFTQRNVEEYEKLENNIEFYCQEDTAVGIMWEDPGVGAIRITETNKWTTGYTYLDMNRTSAMLSNLFQIVFTVVGYFLNTGYQIALDVARTVLFLNWGEVVASSPGTIKSSHSYSYTSKLGQVWYNYRWNTLVDIERRYTYGHGYASFKCSDGLTRTGTKDYLSSPILIETRPYYNNHTWISNTAHEIYLLNRRPYIDAWTH